MMNSDERITMVTEHGKDIYINYSSLPQHIHTDTASIVKMIDLSIDFFFGQDKNKTTPKFTHQKSSRRTHILLFSKHVHDDELRLLCETVFAARRELEEINDKLYLLIAGFLNIKKIPAPNEFDKIARKRHRLKEKDIPWQESPEYVQLYDKLLNLKERVVTINEQIVARLVNLYDFQCVISLGDQKAKSLIDRSYNAKPKKALEYLEKALSYGQPTFMSYKAYSSKGDIHKQAGEFNLAIDDYSTAMAHLRESTINCNRRDII